MAGSHGTQTVPFGSFWLRYKGPSHARRVTRPPFLTASLRARVNREQEALESLILQCHLYETTR